MVLPRRTGAILAFWLAAVAGSPAAAVEAYFEGVTRPDQPILLTLSDVGGVDVLAGLAVELDGADVTSLLSLSGDTLVVQPITPLGAGTHQLTIYFLGATNFEVVGEWTFTIEGGAETAFADVGNAFGGGTQADGFEIDATHEASYIVGNRGETVAGTSAGEARLTLLDGQLKGGVDYLFATEPDARLTDNVTDIGEYFLEFRQPGEDVAGTLRLGHQIFDHDDVLVSDLNRRGASMELAFAGDRVSVSVFGTNPRTQLGVDNSSGLQDPRDRIVGGALTIKPFAGSDFAITATGYSGHGTEADDTTVGVGDGGALSAEAGFLDGRLRFKASGGMTRSDPDGSGQLVDSEDGYAVLASVSYDVLTGMSLDGEPAPTLVVNAGYERVEEDYFSFAFPGMATGRESLFADAYYAFESLGIDVHALHQTDNVEGNPQLATNRLLDFSTTAYYSMYDDGDSPAWLGQATLDASFAYQTQNEIEAPVPAFAPQDFTSLDAGVGISSSFQTWGWNARYGFAKFDDESGQNFDQTSQFVSLGFNLRPRSGFYFDVLGTARMLNLNGAEDRTDFDLSMSLVAPLIEDRLRLTSSYLTNFSTDTLGPRGGDFTADLAWTVFKGVEVAGRAGIVHGDSTEFGDLDYYGGVVVNILTRESVPGFMQ